MNITRRPRLWVIVLAVAAAIVALGAVALPVPGLFLVVADPLERSDAIFVLDGATPARELEAAALYRRGLAPLVAVTLARDPMPAETRRMSGQLTPQEEAARVLEYVGVPSTAIVRLTKQAENTEQELTADYEFARSRGFRRVIVVTSPYHTRRVRMIWDRRFGHTIAALVEPTPFERFVPQRWWRSRRHLEMTVHELVGIANFYLGAPIATFDREG